MGHQAQVLAFDLGGTKIAAAVVNARGRVMEELREPALFADGKAAVLAQMTRMGKNLISSHRSIKRVGIASAGPLDPVRGVLLDPTNFASKHGSWGKTPLASLMSKRLGLPVTIENDAAAAMLAEAWIGAARKYQNAMILTLGTGLGTGVLCNGELLRSGRHLHPEAGHLIIHAGDRSAPCGCGNLGCAEAYLSGRNFARRAALQLSRPNLSGEELTRLARARDPQALAAFAEYGEWLAIAVHNYVVIYCPEIVVVTGGFAEAADLFLETTERKLEALLKRRRTGIDLMPQFAVSALHNQAGLIGAAWIALKKKR